MEKNENTGWALGALILLFILLLGLIVYSFYRVVEEGYFAKKVTISVRSPDDLPIPSTIVRLESDNEQTAIELKTDEQGQIHFRHLPRGTYKISAPQKYCDGGNPTHTMAVMIQGQKTRILYSPCG